MRASVALDLVAAPCSRATVLVVSTPIDDALVQALVDVADGLDVENTLQRILDSAIDLTGARYGALGVLREGGGLQRFLFRGMTEEEARQVGHVPEGLGLLGHIVRHPQPLRLTHIADHPESVGFPAGHPTMDSFLGLPIRAGETVYGNIYLTDKPGGFDADDEARIVALAAAAGVAISNGKLYASVLVGEQWQTGVAEMANAALVGEDGGTVLELLARHSREVTGCTVAMVLTPEDDEWLIEVLETADTTAFRSREDLEPWLENQRAAIEVALSSTSVVRHSVVVTTTPGGRRTVFDRVGTFPIRSEDEVLGVLVLLWQHPRTPTGADRIGAVTAMAAQAAVSLKLESARRAEQQLLVFRDRDRIARDLHDLVVQRLFASGVSLQVLQRSEVLGVAAQERVERLVEEIHATIAQIRGTIFELREGFTGHAQVTDRLQRELDLMTESLGFAPRLDVDAELTTLDAEDILPDTVATVREGLSNIARHAGATSATVRLDTSEGWFTVFVEDNGTRAKASEIRRRSGLANLQERADARGGYCRLSARRAGGSLLTWTVPLHARDLSSPG